MDLTRVCKLRQGGGVYTLNMAMSGFAYIIKREDTYVL